MVSPLFVVLRWSLAPSMALPPRIPPPASVLAALDLWARQLPSLLGPASASPLVVACPSDSVARLLVSAALLLLLEPLEASLPVASLALLLLVSLVVEALPVDLVSSLNDAPHH